MFYDDEPEKLPWDYFLNEYERDLLTLTLEEMACKNPDKTADELKSDLAQIEKSQAVFEKHNRR